MGLGGGKTLIERSRYAIIVAGVQMCVFPECLLGMANLPK